jgi:hypothetical protein
MGMFDDVSLSPDMREAVKAQYEGKREIGFDGWQSKSFARGMNKVVLHVDHVTVDEGDGSARYDNLTREVRFYKSLGDRKEGDWEWLEFIAMYVDGKLVAVRHQPEVHAYSPVQ